MSGFTKVLNVMQNDYGHFSTTRTWFKKMISPISMGNGLHTDVLLRY